MPVLGKWLVRIETTVTVDAANAEQAKEEALSRRFIPVSREVVEAVPRYGGVIDDGPPATFPGYSLCRTCLGPHWTRDHDRAWQAIADQTGRAHSLEDEAAHG